ncbi:MAG TPA: cation transporter [Betaproteobacteria bacterium]|nr:cation transporter [Betaproteobacteria bacterium]
MAHDHQHQDYPHHDEHDHHDHAPGHSHAPKDFGRAFLFGIILNSSFVVAEAVYGILGNSLALLADAGHNLGDVLGLLLAWGASVLVKRIPSKRYTYGLRSTSIMAALINAVLLLVVTGGIAWEAVLRFRHPSAVEGMTVIVVAAFGVAINLGTALLFMAGRKGDLNVRGAFTHMAADAAISLGVVIAGFVIIYTGWHWLDPAVSLIISILIVIGTWGLLRDSLNLALHAVPAGIDSDNVRDYLTSTEGVSEVHDLHIWAMSTTETALTVHLVMPAGYPSDAFRSAVVDTLHERFKIAHSTIQIEINDSPHSCKLAPAEIV